MIRILPCIALAFSITTAFADPVTLERINGLPAAEQPAWKSYLETSKSTARADQAAIQAEVAANQMAGPVRAPSGGDFKLKVKLGDPWFGTEESKQLADAVLSYQTPGGGWSKHLGFSQGKRKPGMLWTSQNEPGQSAHYVCTFDNGSTTSEMNLLAGVWLATKRDDCKEGFIKGLKFIIAAQYPNGGWPQVYPLEGAYHDDITFNDDAMTHVLEILHGISTKEPAYGFLDDSQRQQAAGALAKGVAWVLKSQITQGGTKTVWCAQFDPLTNQPSSARKMEPATLSGLESAHILKFLMTLPAATPELISSIESGLKWFAGSQITDPASGQAKWARFYSLTTGKPVFPGRDGILYETFEAMAATNKLGYDYYTTQPGSIVKNGQQKWRKLLAAQAAK